eukprot:1159824-Pelagomonas_calceolata.AAC.1
MSEAAVIVAIAASATVGAAAQMSRSQHGRIKLQSLQQWQAKLLSFENICLEDLLGIDMTWMPGLSELEYLEVHCFKCKGSTLQHCKEKQLLPCCVAGGLGRGSKY